MSRNDADRASILGHEQAVADRPRKEKIAALTAVGRETIHTANIGCWMRLGEASPRPMRHWLEAVDDLPPGP